MFLTAQKGSGGISEVNKRTREVQRITAGTACQRKERSPIRSVTFRPSHFLWAKSASNSIFTSALAEERIASSNSRHIIKTTRCSHRRGGRGWSWAEGFQNTPAAGKRPFLFLPRLTQTRVSWSSVAEQSGSASSETSRWQRRSQAALLEDLWSGSSANTWSCVHGTQDELGQDESTQHLSALRQSFNLPFAHIVSCPSF